jgi:hypothetical protein
MNSNPLDQLKIIRFEGEMLPHAAQLLDLAARLCPVSEETRSWFSRFTNSSGVDDARTVAAQTEFLRRALREHKDAVFSNLLRGPEDCDASRLFAAWEYALDTMALQAGNRKTCSWLVEGKEEDSGDGYGEGEITSRRV